MAIGNVKNRAVKTNKKAPVKRGKTSKTAESSKAREAEQAKKKADRVEISDKKKTSDGNTGVLKSNIVDPKTGKAKDLDVIKKTKSRIQQQIEDAKAGKKPIPGKKATTKTLTDQQADSKANEIVDKNVGVFTNDNKTMGKELAKINDPRVINKVLNQGQGRTGIDADNISHHTTKNMTDKQVKEMAKSPEGLKTLRRMRDSMSYGQVSESEKQQIKRLEQEVGQKPDQDKSIKFSGAVPKPLQRATENGKLDLKQVTPEMLNNLSPQEKRNLMSQVSKQKITVWKYDDPQQPHSYHPSKQSADKFLMQNISEKDQGGKLTTDLFASLPPTRQSSIDLTPDMSKKIVKNMKSYLNQTKKLVPTASGDSTFTVFDANTSRGIANVVKSYPVKDQEGLKQLIPDITSAAEEVAGKANHTALGTVEGAVIAGFIKKAEVHKQNGEALDWLDTVAGATGDASVPIQLAIKAVQKMEEAKAAKIQDTGTEVYTQLRRHSQEKRESVEQDKNASPEQKNDIDRQTNARLQATETALSENGYPPPETK